MEYLTVPKLEQYQHYKQRRPPWIKLYYSLLQEPWIHAMSDASKLHTIAIMLLASQHDNKIPFNKSWISRTIAANQAVKWDEVLASGFIKCVQDASDMLAGCKQVSIVETEVQKYRSTEVQSTLASAPPKASISSWTPSADLCDWAIKLFPEIDTGEEAEKFRDYHQAKGTKLKDLDSAFRNWVRNAKKWNSGGNNGCKSDPEPEGPGRKGYHLEMSQDGRNVAVWVKNAKTAEVNR